MYRSRSILPVAVVLVLGLLATLPLAAYTIYLKDGSTVIAKEKYRLQGDRAYIVLLNGTETFIRASEIDVARTEEANKANYGSAVVIGGGETREEPAPEAAPPPPGGSLADLAGRIRSRPRVEVASPPPASPSQPGPRADRTAAGFLDLTTLPRKPLQELEIAALIQRVFRGQGIEEVQIYHGTRATRPLVEVTTNSEASVFRSLAVGASALLQLSDGFPGRVEGLELVMLTPTRQRAGQFTLTPEMARQLIGKEIDITSFFLRYVEF